MKQDRAAFQDLLFEHFKNVEAVSKKLQDQNCELKADVDAKNEQILHLKRQLEARARDDPPLDNPYELDPCI